ncbi:Rdx family protein [bacterium]|nr:Rdx family protein [candidate division CSSED10-310 bacterium]
MIGEKVEIRVGSGGVFDIMVDGRRVYSKHQTGRFPIAEDIARIF